MGVERFFIRFIIVVEFGWDLLGKKIIKLKIVYILCEFFLYNDDVFYKLVYIYNLDYDIFVCLVIFW